MEKGKKAKTGRQKDREIEKQRDKEKEKDTKRQRGRGTERQTERQLDRKKTEHSRDLLDLIFLQRDIAEVISIN